MGGYNFQSRCSVLAALLLGIYLLIYLAKVTYSFINVINVYSMAPHTIHGYLGDRIVRSFHIRTYVVFREDETEQVRVLGPVQAEEEAAQRPLAHPEEAYVCTSM